MHNENLMREALQAYLDAGHGQHADPVLQLHARKLAEQALAHVNETRKNEHDSDDVLKRAPLVRLTDEDIEAVLTEAVKSHKLPWLGYKPDADGEYTLPVLSRMHYGIAYTIMDATEKLNK